MSRSLKTTFGNLSDDIQKQIKYPRFFDTLPAAHLRKLVVEAYRIDANSELVTPETALWAIGRIDNTVLAAKEENGLYVPTATEQEIVDLCRESKTDPRVAATCTWPKHLPIAGGELAGSGVRRAVVVNFPHGDLSPDQVRDQVSLAISGGADEIDVVANYAELLKEKPDLDLVERQILAAANACNPGFLRLRDLKVIQKASVHGEYGSYDTLKRSVEISMAAGADCIKSCTGFAAKAPFDKVKKDSSVPETVAAMLHVVARENKRNHETIWPKISGGQSNEVDAARTRFLVRNIMGPEYLATMRFGASRTFRQRLLEYVAEQGRDPGVTAKNVPSNTPGY